MLVASTIVTIGQEHTAILFWTVSGSPIREEGSNYQGLGFLSQGLGENSSDGVRRAVLRVSRPLRMRRPITRMILIKNYKENKSNNNIFGTAAGFGTVLVVVGGGGGGLGGGVAGAAGVAPFIGVVLVTVVIIFFLVGAVAVVACCDSSSCCWSR